MVAAQKYIEPYKSEFDKIWQERDSCYNSYKALEKSAFFFSLEKKKAYIFYLIQCIATHELKPDKSRVLLAYFDKFNQLFYTKKSHLDLNLDETDWLVLLECFLMPETHKEGQIDDLPYRFTAIPNRNSFGFWVWDWAVILSFLQDYCKQHGLSTAMRTLLDKVFEVSAAQPYYFGNHEDKKSMANTYRNICFWEDHKDKNFTTTPFLLENDDWGTVLNEEILSFEPSYRDNIYLILRHCATVSGGKPSPKWWDEALRLLKPIDAKWWAIFLTRQFQKIQQIKTKETVHTYMYEHGVQRQHSTYQFLNKDNQDVLKGLVWTVQKPDKQILTILSGFIERCFEKIPSIGPSATAVGNAGLWVMSNTEGLDGVNYLSRLRLRVKQTNTQGIIAKYLQEAAIKNGMTTAEIEDLAADSFGLTEGVRVEEFGDYRAELHITGIGKTEIRWFKPDGTPQKTEPTSAKTNFPEELKALKNDAKQIQLSLTTQRDRIDRLFRTERWMSFSHFKNCYLEHGLMGFIAKKLIWTFKTSENKLKSGVWTGEKWLNTDGTSRDNREGSRFEVSEDCQVKLWHPAEYTVAEVQKWRALLEEFQIQQPMKQAHREVYWLTDAEINTNTYSNRFAAHILKQHQFNSLAKNRGWKYNLLGCYDKGYESEKAIIEIPEAGFKAEFWVSEVNQDDEFNETGIWNYISTDQVRFARLPSPEQPQTDVVAQLSEVPPLLLSEILRDVDMFVGVASVGNDPAWRDNGGLLQFRNYWQSYSFGELGETAKTRHEILKKLLPKLKIAKVASLDDKFLIVNGKLRTYKIHLGSTNILMTPNDQYLCIVPDRSKPKEDNLFLPFEGDAGLSVIISKAFLLAADDKITDATITSQINRK